MMLTGNNTLPILKTIPVIIGDNGSATLHINRGYRDIGEVSHILLYILVHQFRIFVIIYFLNITKWYSKNFLR